MVKVETKAAEEETPNRLSPSKEARVEPGAH